MFSILENVTVIALGKGRVWIALKFFLHQEHRRYGVAITSFNRHSFRSTILSYFSLGCERLEPSCSKCFRLPVRSVQASFRENADERRVGLANLEWGLDDIARQVKLCLRPKTASTLIVLILSSTVSRHRFVLHERVEAPDSSWQVTGYWTPGPMGINHGFASRLSPRYPDSQPPLSSVDVVIQWLVSARIIERARIGFPGLPFGATPLPSALNSFCFF